MAGIPEFKTKAEAWKWMDNEVNDCCIDNHRFALHGDEEGMAKYDRQKDDGCCGSFDREIIVNGLPAKIGCNYGH